jgi:WD40 repeat protein
MSYFVHELLHGCMRERPNISLLPRRGHSHHRRCRPSALLNSPRFDFAGGGGAVALGAHDAPVRCVEYLSGTQHDTLLTGGWDATVRMWDHRASTFLTATLPLPGKVYAMDVVGSRLIVGCAGRMVVVYDLRDVSRPEQTRESSLKYQTRCVRLMPDASGGCRGCRAQTHTSVLV